MKSLLNLSLLIVSFFHFYFFYLEYFVWSTPKGLKLFQMTFEQARFSSVLAANQGIYNLLLGLFILGSVIYSFMTKDISFGVSKDMFILQTILLLFVVLVGFYGGLTVSKGIFLVQMMPACIALILLMINFSNPIMNDISTSFDQKMVFLNKDIVSKKIQKKQIKCYPDLNSLYLKSDIQVEYKSILNIIKNTRNWKLVQNDIGGKFDYFLIIVEARSSLFNFIDDILIYGTFLNSEFIQIDMRSVSRVGKSDFSVNANRIRDFFKKLNKHN